jgi:hypothetical protein
VQVIVVYVGAEYEDNIAFGIDHNLWGYPRTTKGGAAVPKGDGGLTDRSTVLLLATGYSGGSPRHHGKQDEPRFLEKFCGHDQDQPFTILVSAAFVDGDLYEGDVAFWPNEDPSEPSMYPYRVPLRAGALIGTRPLDETAFSIDTLKQIRLSILGPSPKLIPEAEALGSPALRPFAEAVSADIAVNTARETAAVTTGTRTLYGSDWVRNRAVEERAVAVATAELERPGWQVASVEKDNIGYDLRCTKPHTDEERHVEVKGTSTASPAVLVSRNEARYAEAHPDTAELFVVGEIDVARTDDGWIATGGRLLHTGPWTRLPDGLRALSYEYEY